VVHAHATQAGAGGGLAYAAALAAALAQRGPSTLVLGFAAEPDDLVPWVLPDDDVELAIASKARSRLDDVRQAWDDRRDALTVVQSPHPPRLTFGRRTALLVDFPLTAARGPADRLRLGRYDIVLANSAFTAGWVRRRWGRDADVLAPAVSPVAARPKEPIIVSVGRFIGGARTKGQVELVDAFRRLGPEVHGRWSLHLAGFVADPAYLDVVRAAADGLPVVLHPDLPRADLDALYGRASLCWHACGLGVDPQQDPERLEHFGIAVVEAMSARAVPLALDAGGPAEIVDDPDLRWRTLDELVARTARLLRSPAHLSRLQDRVAARAADFAPARFRTRVSELLGPPR